MAILEELKKEILSIDNEVKFNSVALALFNLHFSQNEVYRSFVLGLPQKYHHPDHYLKIPFLPISFFKNKKVLLHSEKSDVFFSSSGTTGNTTSRHYVSDLDWYINVCNKNFKLFYGNIEDYCVLALLPSYLERDDSSLIVMVDDLIKRSKHPRSDFYLNNFSDLYHQLNYLKTNNIKTILLGVSFALLDFIEQFSIDFPDLIIMETGGMKGRRKELIREELHMQLKNAFHVSSIHSEYGMTELFSQAYAYKEGIFNTPPWMKIIIRDSNDPFSFIDDDNVGGINIIDLANLYSCPFIATQDLGKVSSSGIEILGRFDNSDIRGCNLLHV